jgi:hypothetical protein
MGIYIQLNSRFFYKPTYTYVKQVSRLLERLRDSDMFGDFTSCRCFYINNSFPFETIEFDTLTNIVSEFIKFKNKPNFERFSLKNNIIVEVNGNMEKIPVIVELWKDKKLFGDISIELDSDNYDFDFLFLGPEKWKKKNRRNLHDLLKILPYPRSRTNLIEKMNVGQGAYPFTNLKDSFYIFRKNEKNGVKDMLDFKNQIKKFYGDLDSNDYPTKEKKIIEDIQNKIIKPDGDYFLPEKILNPLMINLLSNQNHFIDEYLREQATVEDGSFILYDKNPNGATLFNLLYKVQLKLNEIYKESIPTKDQIEKNMIIGYKKVINK